MLTKKSVEKFLDEVASKSLAPGGGSTAALSGALAAALVSMVCQITIGKKSYKIVQKEIKKILMTSEKLRQRLTELVDEDTRAYNQVVKAYKLIPRLGLEKALKWGTRLDIEKALKWATKVPLETARRSKKVLEQAKKVAKIGSKEAVIDVKAAELLAQAAIKAALLNVKINLSLIRDKRFKKKIERIIDDL